MNLENLNLVELDNQEVKCIEGGILGWIVGAVVTHIAQELLWNPDQHLDAWQEGYNSHQKPKS